MPSALDLNYFKCYRVRPKDRFASRTVTLADQFETQTATVVKPRLLCNPVDKNGEGIFDPAKHLTCYTLRQPTFRAREVIVESVPFCSRCRLRTALPPGAENNKNSVDISAPCV